MAALETTTISHTLLADVRNTQLLVTGLCLSTALLVAAIVLALINRWRKRGDLEADLSPSAQLAQFRSLYEAGEISKEEFERLRVLLGGRMRRELGVPPPASDAPAKPSSGETGDNTDNPQTGIRPA